MTTLKNRNAHLRPQVPTHRTVHLRVASGVKTLTDEEARNAACLMVLKPTYAGISLITVFNVNVCDAAARAVLAAQMGGDGNIAAAEMKEMLTASTRLAVLKAWEEVGPKVCLRVAGARSSPKDCTPPSQEQTTRTSC